MLISYFRVHRPLTPPYVRFRIRQWADTIDTHDDQTLRPLTLDLPDEEVYFVRLRDEDGRGLEPHVECSFFNQDSSGSGPQQGASAGMRQ